MHSIVKPPAKIELPLTSWLSPPKDEWYLCVRMVVRTSENLPEGTLLVVT